MTAKGKKGIRKGAAADSCGILQVCYSGFAIDDCGCGSVVNFCEPVEICDCGCGC